MTGSDVASVEEADDVGPDVTASGLARLGRLVRRSVTFGVADQALTAASARLANAQAAEIELRVARELRAERAASRRQDVLSVLQSQGTVVVVGAQGAGKTVFASRVVAAARAAGVSTVVTRGELPPPNAEGAAARVEVVDDAGWLLSALANPQAKRHAEVAGALATSRHRNTLRLLLLQSMQQMPPSFQALGFGLLVTSAPLLWRMVQAPEIRELLDRAAAVLSAAEDAAVVGDPAIYAYVDRSGRAVAVHFAGDV